MKISTASRSRKNLFDRSSFHLCTFDFGKMFVTNILPLTPGDTVNVNLNQFFRMAPLAVPTYGSMRVVTKAFFVPFRLIAPQFNDFYRQTKDSSLQISLPQTSNSNFWNGLRASSALWDSNVSGSSFDFNIGTSTAPYYLKLNDTGRNVFQILTGLGYSITPVSTSVDSTQIDLMPLIAFLRVCYDWLYPPRYVDGLGIGDLFYAGYSSSSDVTQLIDYLVKLNAPKFDDDFFIRCWTNFNSPSPAIGSDGTFNLPSASSSGSVVDTSNNTNYNNTSSSTRLTSAGLRLLESVADIAQRTNITGRRFIDYIKGVFGFSSDSQRHDTSTFIKSFSATANLMDVTNVAASDTEYLGSQAGKGYINGNGHLRFDVDEHGYMLFVSYLLPITSYYQGRAPWTIAKSSPFDYYRPEFDSLGNEAIRNDYVFNDYVSSTSSPSNKPNGVFGFAPRYAFEYKVGHDFVSGDFRLNSKNIGLSSYHTMRVLDRVPVNNADFQTVNKDFDRIFATSFTDGDSSGDHFVGYFNFDVKVSSHMLSISESLPVFNKSGRETDINAV